MLMCYGLPLPSLLASLLLTKTALNEFMLVKYLEACNMLCLFMQHECFFSILTIQISFQVTFVVRELKQIAAAVNGTVGTNNECLVVASARAPNILGRGEKLEGEISLGNKQTKNYNITLSKPIHPKYRARYVISCFNNNHPYSSADKCFKVTLVLNEWMGAMTCLGSEILGLFNQSQ